jgi:hypothetical protein
MGEGRVTTGNWYGIYKGQIVKRVKEPTETSRTRQTQRGDTIHEETMDYLEGKIVKIEYKESESFNNQIVISLDDGKGWQGKLAISEDSGYASTFMKIIPNADISQQVLLYPTYEVKDNITKTSLLIKQGSEWLKWYFTKDEPNGLPAPVQRRNGKWDYSEQDDFLLAMLLEKIAKKVEATAGLSSEPPQQQEKNTSKEKGRVDYPLGNKPADEDEDDGLPF